MPGLLFKAEAIVAPEMLVQYLGAHDRPGRSATSPTTTSSWCMLWSSLAARDARLAATALARLRPPPARTGWVTYLRCHDDIGWAVSDVDAAAVGIEGFAHRVFWPEYYAGLFPGLVRPRGALPGDAVGRGADVRDGGDAVRHRGGAGQRVG